MRRPRRGGRGRSLARNAPKEARGLLAVIVEDPGARTAVARRLRRTMVQGAGLPLHLGRVLHPPDEGGEDDGVSTPGEMVWVGAPRARPLEVLAAGCELLLPLAGAAPLTRLRNALNGEGFGTRGSREDQGARERELESAPEELRKLERELRELIGDHAEAEGDLEAATEEWLRERQDAETQLMAYRDRARELKAQLGQLESAGPEAHCPTCGRPLDELHPDVVTHLREEWETVVQDGSWWKRRHDQLEATPEHVQELEQRALRLQSAIDDCYQRGQPLRRRVEELAALRSGAPDATAGKRRPDAAASPGSAADGRRGEAADPELAAAVDAVLEELDAEVHQSLLERAGDHLLALSGGRILGLSDTDEGTLRLVRVEAPSSGVPAEEELIVLSLRLASAHMAHEHGVEGSAFFMEDDGLSLGEDGRPRLLERLGEAARQIGQVVVLGDGTLVDAAPEFFDQVFEVEVEEGGGRWSVHAVPAGRGRVSLRVPARPGVTL